MGLGEVYRGIVVKMLDCSLEVSEFEFQPCYNVHFQTNTFEKGMNIFISPAPGLNRITYVFFLNGQL